MAMRIFDFGFARGQEWVVCLAVACVLELYTAFRIPAELEKEKSRKTTISFKTEKTSLNSDKTLLSSGDKRLSLYPYKSGII